MPTLRLFVAIDTPPSIKPQISAIRDVLKESDADVRWEPDEKLHGTIKFLGPTREELLPEIVSYLRGVAGKHSPPRVQYKGIGCFPDRRNPRVIWVGIQDLDGEAAALHRAFEEVLLPLGFEKDDRKFHPHVTLGRVKGRHRMESLLESMESTTFESQPVLIREFVVVKSELKTSGSVYTVLKSIPFNV